MPLSAEQELLKRIFPHLVYEEEPIKPLHCSRCGIELDKFLKIKGSLTCRICYNFLRSCYYQSHTDQCKSYVDPQKVKKAVRRWQKNHPEVLSEYRRSHAEEIRANSKRWARDNPDKARLKSKLRGYRERNAEGKFTIEEWNARLEEYHWRCAYCGCELDSHTITVDHQIPISRGGTNYIENLVPACKSCNSKKSTKTSDEYLMKLQGG